YGLTFNDPRYNWMYESEPDPALDGRRSFVPRGKVLGGSSSINAMVYVRGHAGDFDDWAAAGNPGWSWQDVLPYFRRCED
ncbi:choline dehydrogenase, partial [Pseudomonas sp. GW704-F2]|uniref:GMC family oxidoreductase N-terminal domain-containing protein n=1 Tax=Pseudomonas sp. GW704-F2 TaxID=2070577 RepID=UPI000CB6E9CB